MWEPLYVLPWAPGTGLLLSEDGSLPLPALLRFSRPLSRECTPAFRASSVLRVRRCRPVSSPSAVTGADDKQVLWFLLVDRNDPVLRSFVIPVHGFGILLQFLSPFLHKCREVGKPFCIHKAMLIKMNDCIHKI